MTNIIFSGLCYFVGVMLLILIHEAAHMLTALFFGIKVNEFSLGMGSKALWQKTWKGIKWSIRPLPIGGYCAFSDADEEKDKISKAVGDRYLYECEPWKRALVLLAGPLSNIAVAFIIFLLMFNFDFSKIADVFKIMTSSAFEGLIGLLNIKAYTSGGMVTASLSMGETITSAKMYFAMIGLSSYVLGVFNILPIPALDGFSALFAIAETIAGRNLNRALEMKLKFVGMIVLYSLMVIMMISDLWTVPVHYFVKH